MRKHIYFLFFLLLASGSCLAQPSRSFPFNNPHLSTEKRVADLVSRMTLEEKVGQMMNTAPAIPRLGIPEYNWWNEGLHGVARSGIATVFPQAIGLAASWDENMMLRVATTISDEARAKYQDYIKKNKRLIYQGLTFWSPNINIFRDPRWGRGQETYGEDPYLTGRLAVQFIRGLQGDDPKYFKTIATVKHFAVHSGPEPERHSFNAEAGERDFRETYLPQFEMGIKEGKAYSVMCAYNRYEGEACCGSSRLLTTILRKEWNFTGYVVSDCGAIGDIYQKHKIVGTPEEAAAIGVRSGCDLECATIYESLTKAVQKNLITLGEINTAVSRLFTARFKLGMFDPISMVKYAQIPYSVLDSKSNHQLALEAAHKSIVLLKNDPAPGTSSPILPFKKDIKKLAVIGPNADEVSVLLGNYNGTPSDPVTPLRGIREKLGNATQVLYAAGSELAEGLPTFIKVPGADLSYNGQPGLHVDYYNNKELNGPVLYSAVDKTLDAAWGQKSPRADMDDDNFGVRWQGDITPEQTGMYQVGIITTCKVTVYIDDKAVANTSYHFRDEFSDPRLRKSVPMKLEAGKKYHIRVDAGESYGDAQVQLVWSLAQPDRSAELRKQALDIAQQADAIILCVGISARLEGEEMDVNIEGFKGGDRTTLDLPRVQRELISSIQKLGKPLVLVLLNGSVIALNTGEKNIAGIVEAWYPGQAAGTAIADVLFGDYNPAGRLPVTFYKSVKDLPDFEDYNMAGRTYRFFTKDVLYPFGYGLSYTTFAYDHLQSSTHTYGTKDSVHVSVEVKNTGSRAGDEVVQLYLTNLDAKVPVALRSLKGFKRVHLAVGEKRTVKFVLPSDAFSIIDESNRKVVLPGRFRIAVGGGQPDVAIHTSNILKTEITLK